MAEHSRMDPAVKHPEHARPFPVSRGTCGGGKARRWQRASVRGCRGISFPFGHQLDERFAGRVHASAAQRRGQQRERAGVAVDGIDECFDGFARGIKSSIAFNSICIQHALDELHRIFAVEAVQLAPVPLGVERRGQRLAAGEDEPRVAHLQQPCAEREDGVQFVARFLGKRLLASRR